MSAREPHATSMMEESTRSVGHTGLGVVPRKVLCLTGVGLPLLLILSLSAILMVVLVFPAYWSLGEYVSVLLWTLHWAEMPGKWLLAGNRAPGDMRLWEHALAYVVPVMFLGVPSYVLLARRAVSRWRVVLSALGWSFFTVQILGTVPMAWVWWCEDHPPDRSTGMEELTVVFPFVLSLVGLALLAVSIVMYAARTRDKTVLLKVWLGKDLLSRSEYLLNRAGLGLAVGGIVLLVLLRLFSVL